MMREPGKHDAFDMYRGGGDGNAGHGPTDPWDASWTNGLPEYDGDIEQDNQSVFRFGLAGMLCSFVPSSLCSVVAFILCVIATSRAKRLFFASALDGHGAAGRVMARIGWFLFFLKVTIGFLAAAFLIWVFYNAVIAIG